ncbi:flagellar hook-basal body complex protein FliE [Steroidobacter sp. S1-65]|uniref:Flagellar hook-basal body complex protein FliE n=1 Tax=Steroidobacter gossypii TaxID=2805490 RepID=A0ABS1X508_9GAMM|nr:flagellar hook-basal body complex protein FliE [Steroidobacter gossypii]MBM0108320.1 flagellar hook-basal body complex protein FliE [Steroidobacter gossypii]
MSSSLQIDAVLSQIRAMQSQIKGVGAPQNDVAKVAGVENAVQAPTNSFANVLKQGLDSVSQQQARASDLATKFEQGVPGVELSQVMLEMQKASVSFRAVAEVRNRFVNAYQEIMNMPI